MCALPRSSGVEELEEFLQEESQETYPDSAGSTAVMGTALRERYIDLLQWYQGLRELSTNSLLNWAGVCFYWYSCAPATPKAISAL